MSSAGPYGLFNRSTRAGGFVLADYPVFDTSIASHNTCVTAKLSKTHPGGDNHANPSFYLAVIIRIRAAASVEPNDCPIGTDDSMA